MDVRRSYGLVARTFAAQASAPWLMTQICAGA